MSMSRTTVSSKNHWTEDEADIAAKMINLLSDYCVKVGMPVILIEAGGMKKMCLPYATS